MPPILGEAAQLVACKAALLAQIARFNKYIDEKGAENPIQIQARLEKVEQVLSKFEDMHMQLQLLEPDDPDYVLEQELFENTHYDTVDRARHILSVVQFPPVDKRDYPPAVEGRAKLHRIQIPTFYGKVEEWLSFRNIFVSNVHNNVHLSNLDKLHYLHRLFRGQSAQVIQALEITEQNYDVAWKLLNNRYHDLKLITHTHLRQIFDQPKLNKENQEGLRMLLDEMLKHISALRTPEQPADSWD